MLRQATAPSLDELRWLEDECGECTRYGSSLGTGCETGGTSLGCKHLIRFFLK